MKFIGNYANLESESSPCPVLIEWVESEKNMCCACTIRIAPAGSKTSVSFLCEFSSFLLFVFYSTFTCVCLAAYGELFAKPRPRGINWPKQRSSAEVEACLCNGRRDDGPLSCPPTLCILGEKKAGSTGVTFHCELARLQQFATRRRPLSLIKLVLLNPRVF